MNLAIPHLKCGIKLENKQKGTIMNELIKINESTIGTEVKQTVNARDLHKFLEIGKDFSAWIKDQISRARLIENQDYLVTEKGEQLPSGMKYLKEYYITIEAGKHIGMMSQSDKGFKIRDYFIECERVAKQQIQPMTPEIQIAHAMLLAGKMIEEQKLLIELQSKQLIEQKPKVALYDRAMDSKDCFSFAEVAKILNIKGLGRNNLMKWLRAERILQCDNIPYQYHMDRGLFNVVERSYEKPNGSTSLATTTYVTQKGVKFIFDHFNDESEDI